MPDKLDPLGFGLGLRTEHYQDIIAEQPKAVEWFEIITEDFLVPGGRPWHYLEQIRANYPLVMHGVSLSIGSVNPLNKDYLQAVKDLAARIDAHWVSDHLCWTGVGRYNMHDLLPLPYTEESLNHVVSRINEVQEFLGRRLVLENPSTYLSFNVSTIPEHEFLVELAKRTGCLLLLDVNNVYVNAFNHGFDAKDYIAAIPAEFVQQFHIAGHSNLNTHIIDTHDEEICADVWALYEYAAGLMPDVSTLLERDDHIPPLSELLSELAQAKSLHAQAEEALA